MKKLIIILITTIALLTSCTTTERNTVTFIDGDTTTTATTTLTGRISYPNPVGRENYIFDCWYLDAELTVPVPQNYKPDGDITVYAGYSPDYRTLVNSIYTDYIRANVTVQATHYANRWNSLLKEEGQGSGVIIREDENYYYCITNNHVTESEKGYAYSSFVVLDCYGTSYEGRLLYAEADSDLSLVAFRKGGTELRTLTVSSADPALDQRVIAVGQPNGLINSVTFGSVERIGEVDISNNDNTSYSFESIWHSAPINHGSSGGALLNDSLEIVGINYAVAASKNGDITYGFAIPASRLSIFLSAYDAQK